ncbi:MAG: hypothetical protein HYS27_03310 [Deltaproteobacteria bacterium]|nr:hypothetical protein [Deltaproteobacteria bacterium]
MDIAITEWALQSYLDLKHKRVFTDQEYRTCIRPDVQLLRDGFPSPHAVFAQQNFWGPAKDKGGNTVAHGFKMKWHNLGPGQVQLRLGVATINDTAYLCRAYVKDSVATDYRQIANLKVHISSILNGKVIVRGYL